MTRVDYYDLLEAVARRASSTPEEARRMVEATLSALASELPITDLPALMQSIPRELCASLRVLPSRASFFDHLAEQEQAPVLAALRHGQAVLGALGELADHDFLSRMTRHLPAYVAAHLGRRAISEAPSPGTGGPSSRDTLASVQPAKSAAESTTGPTKKITPGNADRRPRDTLADGAAPSHKRGTDRSFL